MPHTTEDNHAVLARIDERVIGIAEDLVALRQSMHDVKDNQNTHGLKIIISERDIIETKARLEDQARKLIEAIRNVDILMMSHHRGESRIKAIGGSALQVIVGLAVIFIAVKFGWQKP